MYRRWLRQLEASGALPDELQVRTTRRQVMFARHRAGADCRRIPGARLRADPSRG